MSVLRKRRTQAQEVKAAYCAPTVSEDTMLYWLARAAKELRIAAGRKQVHVAASIDKDQSTIWRFEKGEGWPRETDLFVAGYADDLDIEPIDIWARALDMWREHGQQATVEDLAARRFADAIADGAAEARGERERTRAAKAPRRVAR